MKYVLKIKHFCKKKYNFFKKLRKNNNFFLFQNDI